MEKIPVNIISGFLGSGKTTAIIKLLKQKMEDEKWAVIINEFGKISIDGQTLQSSTDAGSVFDISGGCICCSARGYFQENLEKIIESGNFQRIIIEPSGLGGTEIVTEIIELKPELKLLPSICLVDITAIENPRLKMNLIYKNQISKASLIVFSKCDLLTDIELQDQLVQKFKTFYPEKQHYLSGTILKPSILQMKFSEYDLNNPPLLFASKSNLTAEDYQEKNYQSGIETVFDSEKLIHFFCYQPSIFRAKGHIQTENGWKLVNSTLSGCIFEPCGAKAKNELVIITERFNADLIHNFNAELENCIFVT